MVRNLVDIQESGYMNINHTKRSQKRQLQYIVFVECQYSCYADVVVSSLPLTKTGSLEPFLGRRVAFLLQVSKYYLVYIHVQSYIRSVGLVAQNTVSMA